MSDPRDGVLLFMPDLGFFGNAMDGCSKKQAVDVGTPATSVEWCPISNCEDLLVCGTYQLIQENDRIGSLLLFRTIQDRSDGDGVQISQQLDVGSGILDVKWCPSSLRERPAIGVVDAKCHLEIFEVENERLNRVLQTTVGADKSLALSLDWSSTKNKCDHPYIATSDSDGHLSLFQLRTDQLQPVSTWRAHDYEAWTVAFDYWNPNVVYSGGDDSRFKGWDVRQEPQSPTFDSRQHTMGVTSIQSNCWKEHVLATGSYDESMVLWDVRHMSSPLASISLDGGVWRIKFNPEEGRYALAACMHGGAAVVDCSVLDTPRRVARYGGHDSMVYGVDWRRVALQKEPMVSSCSFYDKAMHLWTFQPEKLDAEMQCEY